MCKQAGFTLIEILISLLIMAILFTILTLTLHQALDLNNHLKNHLKPFHQLQITSALFDQSIQQALAKPLLTLPDKRQTVFIGTPQSLTLTQIVLPHLQQVTYSIAQQALWYTLDAKLETKRLLLSSLRSGHFDYLDHHGQFHSHWPPTPKETMRLPRGVRLTVDLQALGHFSQLSLLSNEAMNEPY